MLRLIARLLVMALPFSALPVVAADFETAAKNAIVMDMESGRVLYAKAIDEPAPTASMSKMVTVYMLLEEMAKGAITGDDTFMVSEKAWRKGGSKMFVEVGERVRIDDLLRGIIIQSGNDASIVVAEGLAGSEDAFAEMATRRMRELGLTQTTLKNATGWPDPEHLMSVHDLARIARLTIAGFPDYYPLYAEKSFTYNDIKQGNRNPVLYKFPGGDGLKTGHTNAAGYGLTASAKRDGLRLIVVLTGLSSVRQRSAEAVRMLEWAFRTFRSYKLLTKGDEIDKAAVWMGARTMTPLLASANVSITMDRETRRAMRVELVYDAPAPAPIAGGEKLGEIVVYVPGVEPLRIPAIAGEAVPKLGVAGRIGAALGYLIFGG